MIESIGYGGMSGAWQRLQYAQGASAASLTAPAAESAAYAAPSARSGGAAAALPWTAELPAQQEGYGPVELAARARVRFPDFGTPLSNALEGKLAGLENDLEQEELPGVAVEDKKSPAEVAEDAKCETCEKRKYQDGSDDPGVSFKTPTKVSPELAASAVRGHEQEHVVRERAEAEREGRKVVEQSVSYHTAICPECGRIYISGGTTRTVTAADNAESLLTKQESEDDFGLDLEV